MCGFQNIVRQPQADLATICRAPSIGFDAVDQLILDLVPEVVLGPDARATIQKQLTALVAEGGRGAAARRLLAREAVLARIALRFREAIATHEIAKFGRNRGDLKRIELLERLVESAHRRLLAATDRLARLDMAQAPRIRISAAQAQVNVGVSQ